MRTPRAEKMLELGMVEWEPRKRRKISEATPGS